MKWENISTTSSSETYQLRHNDKKLLTLTLHPFSNTARVDCEEEKRVFLIRKEGFRRNKTVLRTEYGIKLGELGTDEKGNFISINEDRFYYSTRQNEVTELVLYKDETGPPLVVCGLDINNGDTSLRFEDKNSLVSHPELLMALSWYMFLPVAKEAMAEPAL